MKQQTTEAQQNLEAFSEYLNAMQDGVGKRFLQIHLQEYGINAVEDFWNKVCKAYATGADTLELSDEERHSLSKALASQLSRRKFMKQGIYGAIVGLGGLMGYRALRDAGDEISTEDETFSYLKAMGNIALVFVSGVAAVHSGITIKKMEREYCRKLDDILNDRDEAEVRAFTGAINQVFEPVLMAIKETRPFGGNSLSDSPTR